MECARTWIVDERARRAGPQRRSALAHILWRLHPYRKKTPGGAGTHTGHTGHTDTRITQGQAEPLIKTCLFSRGVKGI